MTTPLVFRRMGGFRKYDAQRKAIRAERRKEVMELLRQGMGVTAIHRQLKDRYPASIQTIYNDIKWLKEQAAEHATCVVCGHEFIPSKGV